jgi:hypothetical protein
MPSRDQDGSVRVPAGSATTIPQARHARRSITLAALAPNVPYLVVLVIVAAGIYISWYQGSLDAGRGAIVAGAGLLLAAVVRLVLPARFAGLLAVRNRTTDVITLIVLGASLLIAGVALPG